ncbi:MAG TPA: phosphopantetheine-protein transferase [Legionella sp.]|nr:phosphopantetheine-protein transferase [Legionella sp.]
MTSRFKSFNADDCTLQPTRIDIWQYPLHTEYPGARALLSPDELTRTGRYHFAKHQRRFAVARSTLRAILARYSHVPARDLVFQLNQYGKPQLVNKPALHFNLSHSEEWALLAIGYDYPLGVDLEFFSARPYEGIGHQMFSNTENRALLNTANALKPLAFFHMWAQKEAFIKACGLGLSYPTQAFDVPALPSTHQEIVDTLHNQTWQMVSFIPYIACCGALCHHPDVTEIRYRVLNDTQLEGMAC